MKKYLLITIIFISLCSYGQQIKTYYHTLNANGTIDSGYVKIFTDSLFAYSDNSFVAFTVERYARVFGAPFPNNFGNYKLSADGIYRNWSQITQGVRWDDVSSKPSTFTPSTHSHTTSDITNFPTTTAPFSNSTNKNFVTDAQLTVIGNTVGTNTGDNATNTQYSGLAASKQDVLVSGNTIKTINGSSVLGSGDLVVSGAVAATTAGVANCPTASGTQTITHNLGRTPTTIRIDAVGRFTSNAAATPTPFSKGIWNSSGNRCIYMTTVGTTTQDGLSSSVFAVFIATSSGNTISGVIQNVGANSFDIVWTETGTAAALPFLWEAQ